MSNLNLLLNIYNILPTRKLISPVTPNPKGSRGNQFAPFRAGVNELMLNNSNFFWCIFNQIYYMFLLTLKTIVTIK